MSLCPKCNAEITLRDNETTCPACNKEVYFHCWNCKKAFWVNEVKRECFMRKKEWLINI